MNVINRKKILGVIALICLLSCIKKEYTFQEFETIVKSNNGPFCIIREDNDFIYELFYRPQIYMQKQYQFSNEDKVDSFDYGVNFILSVKPKNDKSKNFLKYGNKNINVNSLQQNIKLNSNNKKIPCATLLLEKSWGIRNDISFLINFPNKMKNEKDITKFNLKIDRGSFISNDLKFELSKLKLWNYKVI